MNKKKKIGTITYHSSYNHGSCLQAYALQTFMQNSFRDIDYSIINLRTDRQKNYYAFREKTTIKNFIKRMLLLGSGKKLNKRFNNYEEFINKKLNITDEYKTLDSLKNANFKFDVFISGSDQIWNLSPLDFDWSYYLEFCHGARKVSYAASFGQNTLDASEQQLARIKNDLDDYYAISVREEGSARNVEYITGKKPVINVDPTLLIEKKEWESIIREDAFRKKDYIFLYDVKGSKDAYKVAKAMSKLYKMPVVIVRESAKYHLLYRSFIKKYEAGPIEFLNLIKNAKMVVSSSFHGTVFSIIFQKPFFSVDNGSDLRLIDLLKNTGLEERRITYNDSSEKIKYVYDIDFRKSEKYIIHERERSRQYLKKALEFDGE